VLCTNTYRCARYFNVMFSANLVGRDRCEKPLEISWLITRHCLQCDILGQRCMLHASLSIVRRASVSLQMACRMLESGEDTT
jgi:hypothetical protein